MNWLPTLSFDGSLWLYVAWNAAAFVAAIFLNSFVEWTVHRFVMHRYFPLIPYGYKHTTSHHAVYGADETYHTIRDDMLEHGIGFTWREYVLFPIFCTLLYMPVEFLIGKPVYLGALAAVFSGLIAFDVLHRRFHNPRDTWFQRMRAFKALKEFHRRHHADMTIHYNVVFPFADICLGTFTRIPRKTNADSAR